MSRIGLTQEQVFAAAQRLTDDKHEVTVQAVRAALGVGSYTTVTQHLRQWREQAKHVPSPTPPPEVHAMAAKTAASLWAVAHEQAQREIGAIKILTQEQIAQAQNQVQDGLQEIGRLEQQLQQNQHHAVDQQHQLDRLQEALKSAENQLAADRATHAHLVARLTEVKAELEQSQRINEEKIEECGRLHGELTARAALSPTPPQPDAKRKGSACAVDSG